MRAARGCCGRCTCVWLCTRCGAELSSTHAHHREALVALPPPPHTTHPADTLDAVGAAHGTSGTPWSDVEIEALMEGVAALGVGAWDEISEFYVLTRSPDAVRAPSFA